MSGVRDHHTQSIRWRRTQSCVRSIEKLHWNHSPFILVLTAWIQQTSTLTGSFVPAGEIFFSYVSVHCLRHDIPYLSYWASPHPFQCTKINATFLLVLLGVGFDSKRTGGIYFFEIAFYMGKYALNVIKVSFQYRQTLNYSPLSWFSKCPVH